MLVIARKQDEDIIINDEIRITVLKAGKRVKIGVNAPTSTRIRRGELSFREDGKQPRARPQDDLE